LRRTLRVAFWPGHTQGRYSGSTWYFDNHWDDLYRNCALHINADSLGARGVRFYKVEAMPETASFAIDAVRDAIGVQAEYVRQERAGDQSFWSCGVASAFMTLSLVGPEDAAPDPTIALALDAEQPPGLPWWWHTREDTIDKIDSDVLVDDTRVYALATLRALTSAVLPLRCAPPATEIRDVLRTYQALADGAVGLEMAVEKADKLIELATALDHDLDDLRGRSETADKTFAAANRRLLRVDRELVMLGFAASAPFDQDLALPQPPVPLLAEIARLSQLPAESDERRFLVTTLVRRRNRVILHLYEASDAAVAARSFLAKEMALHGQGSVEGELSAGTR